MNYDKIYDQLMAKAINRQLYCPLVCYTEDHHILPKCIFPEYTDFKLYPDNKAVLTPEEHYVAHLLLVKMNRYKNHSNYSGLIYAAVLSQTSNNHKKINNKLYGWLRRKVSEIRKGKTYDEIYGPERAKEITDKRSKTQSGVKKTADHCANIAKGLTGISHTEERIRKNSEAHTGEKHNMYGKKQSKETKRKRSSSMTGRIRTPEHCKNISIARSKQDNKWSKERIAKREETKRLKRLKDPKYSTYERKSSK